MRKFNVTGNCIPEKHYFVKIDHKVEQIFELIEEGAYFMINRPRQYGKTTTFSFLAKFLIEKKEYLPIKISFEGLSATRYEKESSFIEAFLSLLRKWFLIQKNSDLVSLIEEQAPLIYLDQLGDWLTEFMAKIEKKVVLLIDEVDKSCNNQLFLDFLGLLRSKYLAQQNGEDLSFHSVILAGVHNVKTLKLKIQSNQENEQQTMVYNSPWNIAADFKVKMSFSIEEISGMLMGYSQEKKVDMNIPEIADALLYYTSGYPFLVSKLCKIIDEKLMQDSSTWEQSWVELASQQILSDKNPNFESLIQNLENHGPLRNLAHELLILGDQKNYNQDNPLIDLGSIYGIFQNQAGNLKIHNRIYEQRIYNYLISKIETSSRSRYDSFQGSLLQQKDFLDFEKVLLQFQKFMRSEYSEKDKQFLERNGRLVFLAFLKPILNGRGFDFKEVEVSEEKRLDIVVTYLSEKYVVELKLWHGEKSHQKGLNQLANYLERLSLNRGYLLIFDLRKKQNQLWQPKKIKIQGKEIFAVWV